MIVSCLKAICSYNVPQVSLVSLLRWATSSLYYVTQYSSLTSISFPEPSLRLSSAFPLRWTRVARALETRLHVLWLRPVQNTEKRAGICLTVQKILFRHWATSTENISSICPRLTKADNEIHHAIFFFCRREAEENWFFSLKFFVLPPPILTSYMIMILINNKQ